MRDAQSSVQMLMHRDLATGQGSAPALPFQLQVEILKTYRVVAVHPTLALQREHQIQIAPPARQKGASPLRCRPLKMAVELRQVRFPQKAIGPLQAADAGGSQFLRQAPLPSSKVALAPAFG
jgi:hypothetical protein